MKHRSGLALAEANDRLLERVRAGEELKALVDHPHVQGWFRAEEAHWIERVLAAGPAEREAAVARVQAIRSLKASIDDVVNGHDRNLRRLDTSLEKVKHG